MTSEQPTKPNEPEIKQQPTKPNEPEIKLKLFSNFFPLDFKDEAIILFKTSIPLVLSFFNQNLLTMMSLFFCGHLGKSELAAVALGNTLLNAIVFATVNGFGTACDTLLPQPFSIATIIGKYLQCQFIFYPVLTINVLTNVLNALLQGLFVYGLDFGVKGSAIGISIASYIQVGIYVGYIYFKKLYVETWPGWSYECLYDWKVYLKLGLAGFSLIVFECINFEVATILSGVIGSTELAVMSICLQLSMLCYTVTFGIGVSGNVRIGNYLGEMKPKEAFNLAKVLLIISMLALIILALLLVSLCRYIPLIFTSETELIDAASYVLKFLSVIVIIDGLMTYGNGVLRSIGAQKYALLISLTGFYAIGTPIGIYLLFKSQLRVLGYWIGIGIGCGIVFIIQLIFLNRIDWVKESEKAHNLSLKKRSQNVETDIETSTTDTFAHGKSQEIELVDKVKEVKNLKRKIFKKVLIFSVGIIYLLVSIALNMNVVNIVDVPINGSNSTLLSNS